MLGNKIKALRALEGLNQLQFASQIGISQTHLSQIEMNKKKPSLELLILIARRFNRSLDDLVQEDANFPEARASG
ncbi:MAG: helix-turn-helix transcriptional regulator [Synergistota bacterium]|nr:helix-turn-helix transcriptional regulator [Synergistota bacterium]